MFEQNCYDGNNVIENRYDSIKRILDNKNDGYNYYTPSIFGKTNEAAVTVYFIDESRHIVYDLFIESAQYSFSSAISAELGYIFGDKTKTDSDYWNDLDFFKEKNIHENIEFEYMSEEDNIVEISAIVKEMIIIRDSIQKVVDKIRKIVDENNIDFRSVGDLSKYNWIGEKITEKDIVFDENWIETFQIDMIGELSEFEFEK